jgi:hypothetical protein
MKELAKNWWIRVGSLTNSLGLFLEPWWVWVKTGSFEFLRICVQRSIYPFIMTLLPADDSFVLGFGVAKKVPKDDALSVCVCVCVLFPKFSCIPQAVPNSTTLRHVYFLSQNSRLVTYIGRPKRRCYIIFYFVSI